MNDTQALDFLDEKLKKATHAAEALGVTDQTYWNWKNRGRISAEMRPKVWALVNEHGGELPVEWLTVRPQQASAA